MTKEDHYHLGFQHGTENLRHEMHQFITDLTSEIHKLKKELEGISEPFGAEFEALQKENQKLKDVLVRIACYCRHDYTTCDCGSYMALKAMDALNPHIDGSI